MWLSVAATQPDGGQPAKNAMEFRDTLAAKMTPALIAEAQQMAQEWMQRQFLAPCNAMSDTHPERTA
jgi:hypothetical protein